jgi:hypothetical protein
LKDINVADLLAKNIKAPFSPKLPDYNEMVKNLTQTVGIKDLNETAVPEKTKKILSGIESEIFSEFGTNIDLSYDETLS